MPVALLRTGLLVLGVSALAACGTVRGVAPSGVAATGSLAAPGVAAEAAPTGRATPPVGAPSGATRAATPAATPAATRAATPAATLELQATYDNLLTRLQSDDPTALTDLEKFSTAHPDLAGPLLNLGLARARAGDEPAAQDYYQRATQVCSRCGPAWNELGVLGRQQGRFADAEQAYLRAIDLQPDYAPAYYNLAVLYELYIPRPDLALQNYERYLQLGDPAGENRDVEKWVADLRRRVGTTAKTASAEGTS